jgi:hypothetical protein
MNGHLEVGQLLLDGGANIGAKDKVRRLQAMRYVGGIWFHF